MVCMFHHFKGNELSRSEKIQRIVVERILATKISDEESESSRIWELKHTSGCIQFARMLADKRGLNRELAESIAALHDISVAETGSYENHAEKSSEIARGILQEAGGFSPEEIETITSAIAAHSDKQIHSDNPYAELAKDADTIDCFLYGEDIYNEKPPEIRAEYFHRLAKLREEFNLPEKKV